MADIVSRAVRSRMMSGIRGRNTKPELVLRRELFRRGLRYRLHAAGIPGRPDMVFAKYKAVLFAHGCFWHGHDCHLFRWPLTRTKFWRTKITRNRARDLEVALQLKNTGWRRIVVWECALKGRTRRPIDHTIERCVRWLRSARQTAEIAGDKT